jgi:hypothetical protein
MAVYSKSFDEPDEQQTPDKTTVNVVKFPGANVARITFQPGWRWSDCIRPVVGGESCQVRHDAWVVGDEPAIGLEFESHAAGTYAKA